MILLLILSIVIFHKKTENQIRKKIVRLYLFFFIFSFIFIVSLRSGEYLNPEFVNYPKNDVLVYQEISFKKAGNPQKGFNYFWKDIPQTTYFKWILISKQLKKLTDQQKIRLIDEFPFSYKTGEGPEFNIKNTNLLFAMSFNKKSLDPFNDTHLSNNHSLKKHLKKLKHEFDISISEYIKILKENNILLKRHRSIQINQNFPLPLRDPADFAWIFYFLILLTFGIIVLRIKA